MDLFKLSTLMHYWISTMVIIAIENKNIDSLNQTCHNVLEIFGGVKQNE